MGSEMCIRDSLQAAGNCPRTTSKSVNGKVSSAKLTWEAALDKKEKSVVITHIFCVFFFVLCKRVLNINDRPTI